MQHRLLHSGKVALFPSLLTIVLLVAARPCAWAQQFEDLELQASDGQIDDKFGSAVSISGDVVLIGAYADDDRAMNAGSAYVYRYDGSRWVEEAKLLASDGDPADFFGDVVSVSGDVAVIGAIGDDDLGGSSGSAYVYRYDGSRWIEETKLLASDGTGSDQFAISISVWGDVVVVGAHQDDDKGSNSGSAYVYRYDGSRWVEEVKLLASDGEALDYFGSSVSVWDDVILVGARSEDGKGTSSGSAYVYRYNGSVWNEEAKLLASDGADFDSFGAAVAVFDDLAVIGAYRDDEKGSDSGSAYVYRYDGSRWVEESKLIASDGAADDYFGDAVAVHGDVIVVGASGDDDKGSLAGAAYKYRYNGTGWTEESKLLASDGRSVDLLGVSVSVSGDRALAGAREGNGRERDTGSAYLYKVVPPGPFVLSVSPDPLMGGQLATFEVTGGSFRERTYLIYSLDGGNCTQFYPPLNVIFEVCNPQAQAKNPLKTGFTDSCGELTWTVPMPGVGSSVPIWFQAVQRNQITPVVATTIEP